MDDAGQNDEATGDLGGLRYGAEPGSEADSGDRGMTCDHVRNGALLILRYDAVGQFGGANQVGAVGYASGPAFRSVFCGEMN